MGKHRHEHDGLTDTNNESMEKDEKDEKDEQ